MVHWFTGSLVHWFIGSLVHWFIGSLVHWFTGSLVHWFIHFSREQRIPDLLTSNVATENDNQHLIKHDTELTRRSELCLRGSGRGFEALLGLTGDAEFVYITVKIVSGRSRFFRIIPPGCPSYTLTLKTHGMTQMEADG